MTAAKVTLCLWYDGTAEAAANICAAVSTRTVRMRALAGSGKLLGPLTSVTSAPAAAKASASA